jgi:hypothetical protein
MTTSTGSNTITTLDALLALYGKPGTASLKKEIPAIHPDCRAFITLY